MERDTLYAAALVKSAINRTAKTTIGSTAAEDSSEEGIEESAIRTTNSMIKDFAEQCEPWGRLGSTKKRGNVYFSDRPDVYEEYDMAIDN
ncbi:hypothetical protein V498_07302, partial [Pseudogymnoascus sp. VKM F-4517 (FW-2822)]